MLAGATIGSGSRTVYVVSFAPLSSASNVAPERRLTTVRRLGEGDADMPHAALATAVASRCDRHRTRRRTEQTLAYAAGRRAAERATMRRADNELGRAARLHGVVQPAHATD